jgi:hypothetical protein
MRFRGKLLENGLMSSVASFMVVGQFYIRDDVEKTEEERPEKTKLIRWEVYPVVHKN